MIHFSRFYGGHSSKQTFRESGNRSWPLEVLVKEALLYLKSRVRGLLLSFGRTNSIDYDDDHDDDNVNDSNEEPVPLW